MRFLALSALLSLAPLVSVADDTPLTKAEYDALANPIKEKLKKANADWTDAFKRVNNAKGVKGAGIYLENYLRDKGLSETTEKKLADAKAADKPNEKELKRLEALFAQTTKDAAKALRQLKDANPEVAKEGLQAVEDQKAAHDVVESLKADLEKLGKPPKK